jgi:hypothetical protein
VTAAQVWIRWLCELGWASRRLLEIEAFLYSADSWELRYVALTRYPFLTD